MNHHRCGELVQLVQTGQREAALGLPFFYDRAFTVLKQRRGKTGRKFDVPDLGLHEGSQEIKFQVPAIDERYVP